MAEDQILEPDRSTASNKVLFDTVLVDTHISTCKPTDLRITAHVVVYGTSKAKNSLQSSLSFWAHVAKKTWGLPLSPFLVLTFLLHLKHNIW